MNSIGQMPEGISSLSILECLDENIIIADSEYKVVWINTAGASLLSHVVPLYGIDDVADIIGMSMDRFHRNAAYQRGVMDHLQGTHRARITIKGHFVADIIVNPIRQEGTIVGYVALLQDVTTKAEEEKQKEQMIHALSVPILKVWNETIAIPLFGSFDIDRGELLVTRVLETCTKNGIQFVLVDVSGLTEYDAETGAYIAKLFNTLRLIGAQGIIVGVSPYLAVKFADHSFSFPTFSTAQRGLEHILSLQQKSIEEKERSENHL